MNKKRKKKGSVSPLMMVLMIAMGCLIGLFCLDPVFVLIDRVGSTIVGLTATILFVSGTILSVIIHEAGHLIFGLMTGYRFVSFRIFSFAWIRCDDGIKLKRYSIPGTAGQCLMSPPEIKDGKIPTVIYNLGGCILGFVFSLIFGAIAYLTYGLPVVYLIFLILSLVNLVTALVNFIPNRGAQISNDGANAISIRKNPESTCAFHTQLSIAERQFMGEMLSDMPEEWFRMPADELLDNPLTASIAFLRAMRLMEQKRIDEARDVIEHILSTDAAVVGVNKTTLLLELLYIASINGDRIAAHRIFNVELKHGKGVPKSFAFLRVVYAYECLILEDEKAALKTRNRIDKALLKLKNFAFLRQIESELECIKRVDELFSLPIRMMMILISLK